MKKWLITFLVILGSGLGMTIQAREPVENAIIYYRFVNGDRVTDLVQYSTQGGTLRCMKYDIMGRPYATIVTADSIFEVSYSLGSYQAEERLEGDIDYVDLTPEKMQKYQIAHNGTIKYLDRNCDSYTSKYPSDQITAVTVWMYEGLELRRITDYKDGTSTELLATYIEENPAVSPLTFQVPEGFEIFR